MGIIKAQIIFRCRKEMVAFRPEQQELHPGMLAEMVRRVVDAASPDKVILFGSRARGDHRPDSDIDLLIIKDSGLPRSRRSMDIHAALGGLPIQVDTRSGLHSSGSGRLEGIAGGLCYYGIAGRQSAL
jgi:predicted nucleotidyltransferase